MENKALEKELKGKAITVSTEDEREHWLTTFHECISKYDRELALWLVKKQILSIIPKEEKESEITNLMSLRDQQIASELSKQLPYFTPAMFDLEMNFRNREFLDSILNSFYKKFDLTDASVCDWMMETACILSNARIVHLLLKEKKGLGKADHIANSGDEVFRLLYRMSPDDFSQDVLVKLLARTALCESASGRLSSLVESGYDLTAVNLAGDSVTDLVRKYIKNYSYSKNRTGDLKKKKDQNSLAYLEKLLREPEKNSSDKKLLSMPVIAVSITLVVVLCCVLAFYSSYKKSSADTSALLSGDTETMATESSENAGS